MSILSEIKELQTDIIANQDTNPDRAYELCEELLALSNQAGNEYGIAFAQYYMCDIMANREEFDATMKKLSALVGSFHQGGFYDFEIKSYNLLGIVSDNKYDTFVALEYYQKAYDIAHEYSFPMYEAITNCNIGCVFTRLEDYKTALSYYEASFNQLRELDQSKMVQSYTQLLAVNLATTYLMTEDYTLAKEYCRIVNDIGSVKGLNKALLDIVLARISLYEGDRIAAHAYSEAGTDYFVNSHSIFDTMDVVILCYKVLFDLGEYELLEHYFSSTLEYAKVRKLFFFRKDVYQLYVDYLRKRGNEAALKKAYKEFYDQSFRLELKESKSASKSMKLKLSLLEASKKRAQALEQNRTLTQLSQTDALTHLPNRYKYDNAIPYYFMRAQKEQKNFCYMILDVDCFKQYNDTYGHLKGDSCLWHISNVLRSEMSTDINFYRYGGDEFVGIYFDKSEEYIQESVERLIEGIKKLALTHNASQRAPYVTVTLGYKNCVPTASDKALTIISEADALLYRNKALWKKPSINM